MSLRVAVFAVILAVVLPLNAQIHSRPGRDRSPDFVTSEDRGDWQQSSSLSGEVRDTGGRGVDNARIELRRGDTGSIFANTYTDKGGRFYFHNIPDGRYEVIAFRGVLETRERVELQFGTYTVALRLALPAASNSPQTVSLAEMRAPEKARSELRKCEDLIGKDKLQDARKHLARALELYPAYAHAFLLIGVVDLREHKFDDASAHLEKAVELDPDSPMAYVALASAYNALGRSDDALRALASSTRLMPMSWQASTETAKAYLAKGDFPAALTYINKAQQLAPREDGVIHLIKAHVLLGLKDYSNAVDELERYLSGRPDAATAADARQTLQEAKAFATGSK